MALQKNYIACLLSDFASVIMDVHDLELEKKTTTDDCMFNWT